MNKNLIALVLGVFSISANAMLIDRGGGFIYDDVLDITWLQDASVSGKENWFSRVSWADGLSIIDSRPGAGGMIYDDWRLASMSRANPGSTDASVDCSVAAELACRDNEYGYLYHQYGVTAATPSPFINVQSTYWTGTSVTSDPDRAWTFAFSTGSQATRLKTNIAPYGMAVRSGDVAAIPLPGAVWLFGSTLGLLSWMRRKSA